MILDLKGRIQNLLHPKGNGRPGGLVYPLAPENLTVEVAYTCNLHCVMCPRSFEGVPQDIFPPELFETLIPHFSRFKYIQLTGYGEPLMSPHLVDFLIAVRKSGANSVITTNGLLLKGKVARRLLEEKIIHINISIDAGTPKTYEAVRGKGTFERLMETLAKFKALKEELHPDLFTAWVFIMMRSNYRELPLALEKAIELGFSRFAAKHLECALTVEGFREALVDTGYVPPPESELIEDLERTLDRCRRIAEGKIELQIHPYTMSDSGMCLVKPTTNLFVDYKGNLSPCCYLNALNTKPYIQPVPEDQGVMGNLYSQSLDEILHSARYIEFQRDWMEGRVPKVCEGCVQLARMREQPLPSRDPAAVHAVSP